MIEKEIVILFGGIVLLIFAVLTVLIVMCFKNISRNRQVIKEMKQKIDRLSGKKASSAGNAGEIPPSTEFADINDRLIALENRQKDNLDRIDVVRYFTDGVEEGRASYSVGITSENRDGMVLTALMYRNGMNLYVKRIHDGESDYPLSREEKEAVSRSRVTEILG